MQTTRLLKVLSLLGFLLLMAPFYDHCNRMKVRESEVVVDSETVIDTSLVKNSEIDTISNSVESEEVSFLEKAYQYIDDANSENAIEMASANINYFDNSFDGFIKDIEEGISKNDYRGFFFGLKNFCFLLIVIITFLLFVLSFKNIRLLHKFSKINLILLSITIACLFLDGFFETITQIKWGYYAFLITNILIYYYSNPKFQSSKI